MRHQETVFGLVLSFCLVLGGCSVGGVPAAPAEGGGGSSIPVEPAAPIPDDPPEGYATEEEKQKAMRAQGGGEDWDIREMYTPQQRRIMEIVFPLSEEIDRLAGTTDMWKPGLERPVKGYLLHEVSDGALDLYWKGELPAEVKAVIAKYPKVRVTVHSVPFDEDEFLGAQKVVMDRLLDKKHPVLPKDVMLEMVDHEEDRSGLIVVLVGVMDTKRVNELQELIDSWIDIPFKLEVNAERSLHWTVG